MGFLDSSSLGGSIAAVTGARGMIGKRIVELLLNKGWQVRVLTRSRYFSDEQRVQVYMSDINNEDVLSEFLCGVNAIFHCAAELRDESKMYSTNVEGTCKLLKEAKKTEASYFCFLSSAGVVGPTSTLCVTEETICHPNNLYEKTKYEAELLVKNSDLDMNISILRPTNVVSHNKPGILSLSINNSWKDRLKVFLKGNESAHIVYVDDVASVALYFLDHTISGVNIYFVAYDDDSNVVATLYNLYQDICAGNKHIRYKLPNNISYFLRKLYRGNSLHGDVRFSNDKLKKAGFVFKYGMNDILKDIYKRRVS